MPRAYGMSATANLAASGLDQKNEAMNMMGKLAKEEQEREAANKRMAAQTKAANTQSGMAAGAMIGMQVGGPWGAAIGAIAGGLFGSEM